MPTQDAYCFDRINNKGSCDIDELDKSDNGTNCIGHKPIVVQPSWDLSTLLDPLLRSFLVRYLPLESSVGLVKSAG